MSMNLDNPMTIELKRHLEERELTAAEHYLLSACKQGVRLDLAQPDEYERTGGSRVGGYPDLPELTAWPVTEDGTKMTFLAQLNLADIAPHDSAQLLPQQGMLYFFLGMDEPAYNIEHRVIYAERAGTLQLQKPDGITALQEDKDGEEFRPYTVRSRSSLELPNYAYVDEDALDIEDIESYYDLIDELADTSAHNWGCMFGYPEGQHDDAEVEAALMLILNESYDYSPERSLQKLTAHFGGDRERAEQEVKDTIMLLEIDSSDPVGFSWWDCGVIHFFMRKEDMLKRDFSRTYCSLYSS
ncbi:YwqG family protein [Paenibacillus apiarius]|uniref:YwqG family protein n=1 Tax=Paenibacillus apiarius TaxID=46240 RepID=A0ABT4DRV3_9BACL|nr:YwqG family protein [Paenibacillus apiarius]MCY9514330.1 YwqG family protein [Paenibacillus apiarius]MCY9520087.1 YwqG family protein [Paenibacillus apiarius]MCY9550094.1 YwqG family protein [Paenibacillus apiarius]MCY9560295.1 YwqG family protein [Paenibacillus apiarius]MCY9683193.1 YwqG family protein [Paenibacillus apiarius]